MFWAEFERLSRKKLDCGPKGSLRTVVQGHNTTSRNLEVANKVTQRNWVTKWRPTLVRRAQRLTILLDRRLHVPSENTPDSKFPYRGPGLLLACAPQRE